MGSLYSFFAPGGALANSHPAYEFRRGQLQMAEAVEQAITDKRHLLVEAGTGTGKTLAYLLPAIRSGKRVIVSTGTKNLQEQLFYKDIPFLEQVLFPNGEDKLRVCYMKGRNNYLCRQKLYDLKNQPILRELSEIEQYAAIAEWEESTQTGDRAEVRDLPENSALWHKLDARAEACTGQKCQQFDRCFITEMRRRASESDIIIVNHHLFFADLGIKRANEDAPDAGVLPDAAIVIFDEAHELEDVAGSYFGVSVGNLRFDELARDIETTLRIKKNLPASVVQACANLRERSQFFFGLLPLGEGRFAFHNRVEFLEENGEEYISLLGALTRVVSELQALKDKPEEAFQFMRRAEEIKVQLGFILESKDRNTVFWIERRGGLGNRRSGARAVFLQATPIDVSQLLRQTLFENLDTAVLTSATLAVSNGFEYIQRRLGLDHTRALIVPSHFDYSRQALLYVPPELPDPRNEQFAPQAAHTMRRVLELSRGRAFCLFTSYSQMHDMYERLLGELEYPMLMQGSAPRNVLLEEFRTTPNAILFATSSFWQGVDVQGEQLSCVIIDRLPFAVPNDPVVAARVNAITEEGRNAFMEYQVPGAVITLKQGFGRLIRSLHDRGVLVLLDNRIQRQRYGRVFLESLPKYGMARGLEDIERFFG
ncbi:MAG TPA: helicase C-terminal domain-containing protein [Terriglobales bacterium]|nr:helicase C-terminal domain-containing protein [Terriglobales bacterium]